MPGPPKTLLVYSSGQELADDYFARQLGAEAIEAVATSWVRVKLPEPLVRVTRGEPVRLRVMESDRFLIVNTRLTGDAEPPKSVSSATSGVVSPDSIGMSLPRIWMSGGTGPSGRVFT